MKGHTLKCHGPLGSREDWAEIFEKGKPFVGDRPVWREHLVLEIIIPYEFVMNSL